MRDRLLYALATAGVPVDRCPAAVGPGLSVSDLTLAPGYTQSQYETAVSVLAGFDWSDAADAQWRRERDRLAAAQSLLTRADELGLTLRAVDRDQYTAINDVREWVGALYAEVNTLRGLHSLDPLPIPDGARRILEPEIIGGLIAGIHGGLGDPA